MSTRYVWEKCDIDFPDPNYTSTDYISFVSPLGSTHTRLNPIATNKYKPSILSDKYVIFTYADDSDHVSMDLNRTYPCSQYPYVVFANAQYEYVVAYSTTRYWYRDDVAGTSNVTYTLKCSQSGSLSSVVPFKSGRLTISDCEPGSAIERISNSSSTKLPTNGISGDYWYKYLGSDKIDPTAITYGDRLRGPEPVTVSITPQTGIYGGTISYNYQYSTDGGETWVAIKTTTETSIEFDIPANAKTISFRVRASDDIGFVSTDFVTGGSATVEWLNAWANVLDKARKGQELSVNVGGKARSIKEAWANVDGKARRFL